METTDLYQFYLKCKWSHLKRHKNLSLAEDFAAFAVEQHLSNPKRKLYMNTLEVDFYRILVGDDRFKRLKKQKFINKRGREIKFAREHPAISPCTQEEMLIQEESNKAIIKKLYKSIINKHDEELVKECILGDKDVQQYANEHPEMSYYKHMKAYKNVLKRVKPLLTVAIFFAVSACTTPKKCIEAKDNPSLPVDERAAIVSECYIKGN